MSLNLRRILAYIFDIFLVSLVVGFVATTPLNPHYVESEALRSEYEEITEEYQDKLEEGETDEEKENVLEEFRELSITYSYKVARLSLYEQLISLTFIIGYYAVFAYFMKGETVGKRLMKIRVIDVANEKIKFSKLLIRTIIAFELPFKILNLIITFTCNERAFYDAYNVIYYVTILFDIAIMATSLVRQDRRGVHDLIAGTKVEIIENVKEEN